MNTVCEGFFLNNQTETLIISILLYYKSLHVSGLVSAHHQEFSTIHSALVSFMLVSADRIQAVRMELQFLPDCLETLIINLRETYQCRMYGRKLLMMGRADARNM
jgi:hypothetical protein